MKRGYDRSRRVADLLQKSLARIILQEMGDKRFQMVTVTGVTVSRDLSYAKVFVSVLSDDDQQIKETVKSLNRAVKLIRYNLAKEVKLRITPELKFVYDESTVYGFKIDSLLQKAQRSQQEDDERQLDDGNEEKED